MVITCENCKSKFKLDDALIKDSGSKVRCSSCRHVFTVYKPAPVEDARSASELDQTAVGQPDEITEEPLDFDLFESEKDQDDGLSLEDFGLGEDDSATAVEKTPDEEVAEEEQITAEDLGFGDALIQEGASESGQDQVSLEGLSLEESAPDTNEPAADKTEAEAQEEISFEDLTLEDESWAAEAAQGDEPGGDAEAEEEISFQDLNLEEEPVVAEETAPETELKTAETSQEEISFDDMDFEDASPEETSPEEAIVEEDKAEWAEDVAAPLPEGVLVASLEEGEEVEKDTFEDMPVPPVAKQASHGRHISMPLLIALIAVLIGGGAYVGFTFLKGSNIKVPFLESIAGVGGDEKVDPGNLHVTLLEDLIAGEFVDNTNIGRLFVIKGKIRSDYPDMRNFIRMKGTLYLRDGKVAADQVIYCGNVLSDTELQALDREAIKKRMTNRFGDNKANFKVPSGKILPFMVVFTDIPQELGEFSVEVVDSLAG